MENPLAVPAESLETEAAAMARTARMVNAQAELVITPEAEALEASVVVLAMLAGKPELAQFLVQAAEKAELTTPKVEPTEAKAVGVTARPVQTPAAVVVLTHATAESKVFFKSGAAEARLFALETTKVVVEGTSVALEVQMQAAVEAEVGVLVSAVTTALVATARLVGKSAALELLV